jgi:hypothetical protein
VLIAIYVVPLLTYGMWLLARRLGLRMETA